MFVTDVDVNDMLASAPGYRHGFVMIQAGLAIAFIPLQLYFPGWFIALLFAVVGYLLLLPRFGAGAAARRRDAPNRHEFLFTDLMMCSSLLFSGLGLVGQYMALAAVCTEGAIQRTGPDTAWGTPWYDGKEGCLPPGFNLSDPDFAPYEQVFDDPKHMWDTAVIGGVYFLFMLAWAMAHRLVPLLRGRVNISKSLTPSRIFYQVEEMRVRTAWPRSSCPLGRPPAHLQPGRAAEARLCGPGHCS